MMDKQEQEEKRQRVAVMLHQHIDAVNKTIFAARQLGLNVTFCVEEGGSGASTLFDSTAEITNVDISNANITYYPGDHETR